MLEWFRSYLSGRVQKLCVGNSSSQWGNITTGVPQGSILGPLLFSLFVNDIPASVSNCVCRLYADDTILYTSGDSISDLNQLLQEDLNSINDWMKSNRLKLNLSKSVGMLIGPIQKIKNYL